MGTCVKRLAVLAGLLTSVHGASRPLSIVGAAVVPQGGKIVFVDPSQSQGNFEIYAMNQDGSGIVRLTFSPGRDENPAWSPDGTKIAFASLRNTPVCDGTPSSPCNWEIYVMNADGSGVTRLTDHPAVDQSPAWSPDGSKIAFTSARAGVPIGVYVMNADGSDVRRITQSMWGDHSVSWSPDGTKLATTRCCPHSFEVWTMNSDGTNATPLSTMTDNSIGDFGPEWSPDGARILFWRASCLPGSRRIELVVMGMVVWP